MPTNANSTGLSFVDPSKMTNSSAMLLIHGEPGVGKSYMLANATNGDSKHGKAVVLLLETQGAATYEHVCKGIPAKQRPMIVQAHEQPGKTPLEAANEFFSLVEKGELPNDVGIVCIDSLGRLQQMYAKATRRRRGRGGEITFNETMELKDYQKLHRKMTDVLEILAACKYHVVMVCHSVVRDDVDGEKVTMPQLLGAQKMANHVSGFCNGIGCMKKVRGDKGITRRICFDHPSITTRPFAGIGSELQPPSITQLLNSFTGV